MKKTEMAWAFACGMALFACASDGGSSTSGVSAVDPNTPGPLMRPGQNCLRCHGPNREAASKPWSAGGTVYPSPDSPVDKGMAGVSVLLVDAAGKRVTLTTNAVGNFYTAEPLKGPINVTLEKDGKVKKMPRGAPAGSCGACHSYPDPTGDGVSMAEGRVYLN
jgi:hypothetical protein